MTKKDNKAIKKQPVSISGLVFKNWQVILIFTVFTLFFFWDIIIQKRFFWEDFVYQYYPFRNFAAVALSNGNIPFWNPYTFGGMPFIADIQTAFFYPLHLVLTLFVSDGSLHFVWLEYLIIFHYFLAGIFSYYFARSLKLSSFASLLSGITFMFCGFIVTHLIHETMIIQFAYMPLIFFLYKKGTEERSPLFALLAGLVMGITILCGHPQITLYIFFTVLLFAVYSIFFSFKEGGYKISGSIIKGIMLASLPFILGIMIGSVQLLPTMTISGLSERAVMTYESTLEGSLGYHQLFTLISPKFFGSTNAAHNEVPFWASKGYWLYWESCIYVGLAALIFGVLAVYAIGKDKFVLFLAAISGLSLLYALGDHFVVYKLFYYVIPGFNKFRGVGRIGLVFAFGFSFLSAYGLDYFIKNPDSDKIKKYLKFVFAGIALLVVLWILYLANVFTGLANTYNNPVFYKNSANQLGIAILILLGISSIMLMHVRNILLPMVSVILILVVAFFDLYIFGSRHNTPPYNPNLFYRQRSYAEEFRKEYKSELFRINSRTFGNIMFFERNQGMIDFVFLMEGYNPLNLQRKFPPGRTHDLMNVKYEANANLQERILNLELKTTYMPRAWMSYKPQFCQNDEEIFKVMTDTTFNYREIVVLEEKVDIRDTIPANHKVSIKDYNLNKIELSVETPKKGVLVLSEVAYPAWKVFVDGNEQNILRCNYSLRGVLLEPGTHKVIFEYKDKDFTNGMVLSIAGLSIIFAGLGISIFRRKK